MAEAKRRVRARSFGRIFYNQARMSSAGIAQLAVVLGSCTAGGAYVPAMADESIIVRGNGTIFLGGPPLVKAATGEVVTAEELGGADLHCATSGIADHFADDEPHALRIARQLVRALPDPGEGNLPRTAPRPPAFDPAEIRGLLPADPRQPMPVRSVLARLLDGSELTEFKARFGPSLITGFAHIHGYQVGVIANDGILFSESAQKGADAPHPHPHTKLAPFAAPSAAISRGPDASLGRSALHPAVHAARHPLALHPEHHRVHGRPAVRGRGDRQAWREARQRRGDSDGAQADARDRRLVRRRQLRHVRPRVLAKLHVDVAKRADRRDGRRAGGGRARAGEGGARPRSFAANPFRVCSTAHAPPQVKEEQLKKAGKPVDAAELDAQRERVRDAFDREAEATYATARLWDDGIVDPAHTREALAMGLAAASHQPIDEPAFGVFRM